MSVQPVSKSKTGVGIPWLVSLAKYVDKQVRFFDLWLNRSDGRWLFPGHSWIIAVPGLIVLLAMTNGPLLLRWRGALVWVIIAAALVTFGVVLHLAAKRTATIPWRGWFDRGWRWLALVPWVLWLLWLLLGLVVSHFGRVLPCDCEVAVILLALGATAGLLGSLAAPRGGYAISGWFVFVLAALAVWRIADQDTTEFMGGAPYRQVLAPIGVLTMFLALPFARWWAWFAFRQRSGSFRKAFQPLLDKTELFDPQIPSNATTNEILRAFFLALVNTPFQLALIPAVALIIAPAHQLLLYGLVALGVSWLLMAMVVFHPRLTGLRAHIDRLVVEGGALLVSVFVIGIAAARIFRVDYVTTVLDGTAGPTIGQYVLVLYAFSWVYNYWSTRALIEIMLGFVHPTEDTPVRVPYGYPSKNYPNRPQWLQAHGGSRIAVLRETGDPAVPYHFNIFRPVDLFREIAVRSPTSSRARKRIDMLEAQVRFFRTFPALLFFGVLVWGGAQLMGTTRHAHITGAAQATPAAQAFSLPRAYAENRHHPDEKHPHPPVYFIAASGGGTRAAIHTMTVLKALADHQVLHRVAGISSVSGGSLANAYFAHRRPDLVSPDPQIRAAAWRDFQAIVTDRHIQYVLDGAFEWRLVMGDRFGTILQEGFARHLRDQRTTLGACGDVAVIFNSTLVGEAPSRDATPAETSGENSGSRLVFTNIPSFTHVRSLERDPTGDADQGYPPDLRYVCFGDPQIRLAATASASANFPPVFSNIAIDAQAGGTVTRRYWVTDGGAMDNRGLISLLLALRTILQGWTAADGDLPPVRILVADASGYSPAFTQDRGLSAVGGARLHISSKLIATLLAQVQALHAEKSQQKGKLTIHDLTLPKAIRSGMGTHWMMPTVTTFAPAKWIPGTTDRSKAQLSEAQILPLFDQVFAEQRAWPDGFQEAWVSQDDPRDGLNRLLAADRQP